MSNDVHREASLNERHLDILSLVETKNILKLAALVEEAKKILSFSPRIVCFRSFLSLHVLFSQKNSQKS